MNTLNKKSIKNLRKSLDFLADELGDVPLQQVIVLLRVAEGELYNEATDGQTMAKQCGVSASAISRHLSALGEWSWLKRPGAEMVLATRGFEDRRKLVLNLTPKGKIFLNKLLKIAGLLE